MKRILLISCIIAIFTDICSGVKENDKLDYRLNTDIEPIDYIIDVTPYFDSNVPGKKQSTFDGSCTITFKTTKANVSAITLHKSNLNITAQSLTQANTSTSTSLLTVVPQNVENIEISSSDYNNKTNKYTLKLASSLIPNNEYILKFEYIGVLYTDGVGFYRRSYQEGNVTKWFAATQLQATLARNMFPCFDEPRFKATFSIIVNRPAHFKPSLSNTPMVSSQSISSNLVREYFDKTPKMSTYLLAILISEFECHENSVKNFSVCVRPEKSNLTEYVLNFGQKMIRTFDELFDYEYSQHMSKLTLATSAFGTGGMENWGLILCGEGSLIYDPSKPRTLAEEKEMAILIAHELSHLWFGDLVTCDWWSHFWLNEGMASYFEWFGLAELKKTWAMDHEFLIIHFYDVMEDDSSLKLSEALSAEVNTPAEISERFGDFIYYKGASIIRMMNYTLGNDKFIAAIRYYLKQNALKTVTPENLYAALQTQADNDFNFTEVFNGWVIQKGHPILSVRVSSDRKFVEIRQNRFLRNDTIHHDKTQWMVPLNWASNRQNTDFAYSKPMTILRNSSMKIELDEPIDWIVFNVQQAGFYRVNYDDETWSAIANILQKSPSSVHVFNRAQLINDAFELARYAYSNYDAAINIAAYLQDEIEYAPWSIAFKYFERILSRFKPNELHIFEEFGLKLLNRVYQHLGFHQKPYHNALDIRNRYNVIKYACKFGNKQCMADARVEYDRYLKGNYTIDIDLAPMVYCSVIEHGSEAEWNSIWNIVKSTDPGFENIDELIKYLKLYDGLSCTKRTNIIKKFLDLILIDEFSYKSFAIKSILTNRQNVHIVMDFVFGKHKEIKGVPVDIILSSIIDVVSTQEEIDRLQNFIKENGMGSNEKLTAEMKVAKSNLRWADEYVPIIKNAIKRNVQKG